MLTVARDVLHIALVIDQWLQTAYVTLPIARTHAHKHVIPQRGLVPVPPRHSAKSSDSARLDELQARYPKIMSLPSGTRGNDDQSSQSRRPGKPFASIAIAESSIQENDNQQGEYFQL
jgi:hypothetical protein